MYCRCKKNHSLKERVCNKCFACNKEIKVAWIDRSYALSRQNETEKDGFKDTARIATLMTLGHKEAVDALSQQNEQEKSE